MDPRPAPTQAVRAALIALVLMMTCGTCGVSSAIASLQGPLEPRSRMRATSSAESSGIEESTRALEEVLTQSPYRTPISVANGVVSVLLMLAAGALFLRRSSAPWWALQACVGNALWCVADGISFCATMLAAMPTLVPIFNREIVAKSGAEAPPFDATQVIWVYLTFFTLYTLARVAMYSWIVWRVRRPDVRELLSKE